MTPFTTSIHKNVIMIYTVQNHCNWKRLKTLRKNDRIFAHKYIWKSEFEIEMKIESYCQRPINWDLINAAKF